MSIHIPPTGAYRDNRAVYDASLWLWANGRREAALSAMTILVRHIEGSPCHQSKHWLLKPAREQLIAMNAVLKHASKVDSPPRRFGPLSPVSRLVAVLSRQRVASMIYYAVVTFLCLVLVGEPPALTIGL